MHEIYHVNNCPVVNMSYLRYVCLSYLRFLCLSYLRYLCLSYLPYLCLLTYNGVQHILCCVFLFCLSCVLCTLCCQFLWIVLLGLPLLYSDFPGVGLLVYLVKVIPEACRMHLIIYLHFFDCNLKYIYLLCDINYYIYFFH